MYGLMSFSGKEALGDNYIWISLIALTVIHMISCYVSHSPFINKYTNMEDEEKEKYSLKKVNICGCVTSGILIVGSTIMLILSNVIGLEKKYAIVSLIVIMVFIGYTEGTKAFLNKFCKK